MSIIDDVGLIKQINDWNSIEYPNEAQKLSNIGITFKPLKDYLDKFRVERTNFFLTANGIYNLRPEAEIEAESNVLLDISEERTSVIPNKIESTESQESIDVDIGTQVYVGTPKYIKKYTEPFTAYLGIDLQYYRFKEKMILHIEGPEINVF